MAYEFWQSIATTPWWIFVAFFMFIYFGFLATKPRTISVNVLLVYPFLFISLSCLLLFYRYPFTVTLLSMWLGAACFGILCGWIQCRLLKMKALRNEKKLQIPGSWFFLILIITLFFVRYYLTFYLKIDFVEFFNRPENKRLVIILYGLFAVFN